MTQLPMEYRSSIAGDIFVVLIFILVLFFTGMLLGIFFQQLPWMINEILKI